MLVKLLINHLNHQEKISAHKIESKNLIDGSSYISLDIQYSHLDIKTLNIKRHGLHCFALLMPNYYATHAGRVTESGECVVKSPSHYMTDELKSKEDEISFKQIHLHNFYTSNRRHWKT